MSTVKVSLPEEILVEVLTLLPTAANDVGVPTLLSCLVANRLVRNAALTTSIWKAHYLARYTHCIEANEEKRREDTNGNWRLLYIARRRLDKSALQLLDEIRLDRSGRHERARTFTQVFSFDAWDALRLESQLPLPSVFTGASDSGHREGTMDVPPSSVPRRFWARSVLGVIARHHVLLGWGPLFQDNSDQASLSAEDALAGLSSFFDVSPQEVKAQMNDIYVSAREKLQEQNVPLDPKDTGYDFWSLCNKIREVLHNLGFRIALGTTFYNIMNQFPHNFINPEHRRTLPISLVYIYVSIARRLGIQASFANFPGVVQVHITPPNPSLGMPSLLDMRSDAQPQPLSPSGPPLSINIPGFTEAVPTEYTQPATAKTMLTRAYHNMMMSIRHEMIHRSTRPPPWLVEAQEVAYYATSCCLALNNRDDHIIPRIPDTKPLDEIAVIVDALSPTLPLIARNNINMYCHGSVQENEEQATRTNERSKFPAVKFFVGQVFRHASHMYTGCIFAWEPTCTSVSLIREMNIDELPNGRNQPIYYALTADGQARYVAQDEVQPIVRMREAGLPEFYRSRSSFGRYFEDAEIDEWSGRGRLVPSAELRQAYPGDDDYGSLWVKQRLPNW